MRRNSICLRTTTWRTGSAAAVVTSGTRIRGKGAAARTAKLSISVWRLAPEQLRAVRPKLDRRAQAPTKPVVAVNVPGLQRSCLQLLAMLCRCPSGWLAVRVGRLRDDFVLRSASSTMTHYHDIDTTMCIARIQMLVVLVGAKSPFGSNVTILIVG